MSKLSPSLLSLLISATFASSAYPAAYQLQNAANKAVQTSPDVLNKWHQFKAAAEERNITWGRYLPTLDVMYGVGRENRESPLYTPAGERRYNFQSAKATLRQNLFEGFATVNDTTRLDHATLVRFYEMMDVSENAALEAAKAYIDVWRFRQLVAYAEENYAIHRVIYEKIKERAQSGVGRKVDLETAAGRLALAESNLLTEQSNLHDVTARFQRVVGELPPAEIDPPPGSLLATDVPKERTAAINRSFEKSPQLKAAFENILSAMRQVDVQKAGYYPRLDAYIERGHDKNVGGYTTTFQPALPGNNTDYTTYGLTVSWNLFNGLRDVSRERKAAEDKNSAKDVREKVCREVRQNSSMAFNDQVRLVEQLQYLDQHQLSSDKAREAFRRQFDIGQRTLLDVLDTENEYYTARRNYLNGELDLLIARARYQYSSGNLLNVLSLKNLDMTPPQANTTPESGMETICPAEPIEIRALDKEDLFKRAQAKEDQGQLRTAVPVATAPAPATVVDTTASDIEKQLKSWAAAWAGKDYNGYVKFYAPSFTPEAGLPREDWANLRRIRVTTPGHITLDVQDIKVRTDGENRVIVEFRQTYRSNLYSDITQKSLEMIKVNGKWLINSEVSIPCTGNTVGRCKK